MSAKTYNRRRESDVGFSPFEGGENLDLLPKKW